MVVALLTSGSDFPLFLEIAPPRLPRLSASSKKTITPPKRSESLRSLRKSDLTLRIPTPMNMLVNAPGSTKT